MPADPRLVAEAPRPAGTLGVIIARFQVPSLHEGHSFLLDYVWARNQKVLVILGETGGDPTQHDPLDVRTRQLMVQQYIPSAVVESVRDVSDDDVWTLRVNGAILRHSNNDKVTLYGGPDSFIPHYKGAFAVERVEVPTVVTGTILRQRLAPPGYPNVGGVTSLPFREGMIFAANLRRPRAFPTVDIAIIKDWSKPEYVLMGRRDGDDGYRFPGGFVDPSDESLEAAARREASEETNNLGVDPDSFKYIGSHRINDWRYKDAPDKIMTALFIAYYQFGAIEAADDFKNAEWVSLLSLPFEVATIHKPLADAVLQYLGMSNNETMRKIERYREEQRAW